LGIFQLLTGGLFHYRFEKIGQENQLRPKHSEKSVEGNITGPMDSYQDLWLLTVNPVVLDGKKYNGFSRRKKSNERQGIISCC
jgi:hypothetical protein